MSLFKRSPSLVGDILQSSLEKWDLSRSLNRYALFDNWEQLVGTATARRSRPLRFQGEILQVEVDHSAWLHELSCLKPKILQKVRKEFPKARIKDIRFFLKSS